MDGRLASCRSPCPATSAEPRRRGGPTAGIAGDVSVEPALAKLSVVGVGMRTHTGVATRMFGALAERGININLINTSEVRINVGTDVATGQRRPRMPEAGLRSEPTNPETDRSTICRSLNYPLVVRFHPARREQSVARDKVVLAYSGGLDTSVAVKWINETYDLDVVAYTCDLGQGQDIEAIRQKALRTGAVDAVAEDARNLFVDYFVFPSLMAGALYEGKYPLATALGRPLIAQLMVRVAREHGAGGRRPRLHRQGERPGPLRRHLPDPRPRAEDHRPGARVEVDADPGARVRRQARHRGRGDQEVDLQHRPEPLGPLDRGRHPRRPLGRAAARDLPVDRPTRGRRPTSPRRSRSPSTAAGPWRSNGRELDGVELIDELNKLAGKHGVGRIDHIENRLVGIKSREIYEAPAAVVLHEAHRELEFLTLSKESLRFKTLVSQAYADLIYNGLWFSQLHQDLMAFIVSNQQYVSGTVRVKLFKGHAHDRRPQERAQPLPPRAGDLRGRRPVRLIGRAGLHQDPRPGPDHPGQAPAAQGQAGGRRLELPSIIPPDKAK